jgi:hypothetical protein
MNQAGEREPMMMWRRFCGTWRNFSHQLTLVDLDLVQRAVIGIAAYVRGREVDVLEKRGLQGWLAFKGKPVENELAMGGVEGGRFACAYCGILSNG